MNLPKDIDPECYALCVALNKLPGIHTVGSCCGHGKEPFLICFKVDSLEALPHLLYWFDSCHCQCPGWRIIVTTDCSLSPVTFTIKGPIECYDDANHIASLIKVS